MLHGNRYLLGEKTNGVYRVLANPGGVLFLRAISVVAWYGCVSRSL